MDRGLQLPPDRVSACSGQDQIEYRHLKGHEARRRRPACFPGTVSAKLVGVTHIRKLNIPFGGVEQDGWLSPGSNASYHWQRHRPRNADLSPRVKEAQVVSGCLRDRNNGGNLRCAILSRFLACSAIALTLSLASSRAAKSTLARSCGFLPLDMAYGVTRQKGQQSYRPPGAVLLP